MPSILREVVEERSVSLRRSIEKLAGGIGSANADMRWKSESAKECVTTHLPNQLALKMDGARASGLYRTVKGNTSTLGAKL